MRAGETAAYKKENVDMIQKIPAGGAVAVFTACRAVFS
jgi:hypothetical protein